MTAQPVFKALSDPTRRDILQLLSGGPMTIGEVAANFSMTRAAVKKHLKILQDGELITVESAGRTRVNQLNLNGLAPVVDWLGIFDVFWDDRLNALSELVKRDLENAKPND